MTEDTPAGAGPLPTAPIDVTAWVGAYPFREVPHPEPATLVQVLAREGFGGAWVGSLPGAFHRDPLPANQALYRALAPHRAWLHPVPIVRPDWPHWERQLVAAVAEGAPAVCVHPTRWGLGDGHPAVDELARACGEAGVVIHCPVRFEDLRQRHRMDTAGDLSAAFLRGLLRGAGGRAGVVVAGAGRELIEEVWWGLTPVEQQRVWFDFHWVWGPPEDQFAHLVETVGPGRLAWSSWWPLRLVQQAGALVDLLPAATRRRLAVEPLAEGRGIQAAAQALRGVAAAG
jgi:hypothetical protein